MTTQTKKAILVVSFGTSYPETRKENIQRLEDDLAHAFPDHQLYRAYTSKMILKKIWERDHIFIPNVLEAMKEMRADGITDILVQPTHIINGIENDKMIEEILPFKIAFRSIVFGTPLLTSTEDYFHVINALMKELPACKEKEALLFMGHGSSHYVNSVYAALDYTFKNKGYPHAYVGTVEAFPSLEDIIGTLKNANYTHVYLTPFMLVAGDHANNDMASKKEDSWKSILESQGFRVSSILKGLGEYKAIRSLYIQHAREAQSLSDTM